MVAVNVWAGLVLAFGFTLLYPLPPPRPRYDKSRA